MKRGLFAGAVALFAMVFVMDAQGLGDKTPTVKEIMKGCMKSGLCKKVLSGKGDEEEKTKLLKMLTALADNKAPASTDDTNWKKMTADIKEACKSGDLEKVKPLLTQDKCMACHKEYKGKK